MSVLTNIVLEVYHRPKKNIFKSETSTVSNMRCMSVSVRYMFDTGTRHYRGMSDIHRFSDQKLFYVVSICILDS